MGELLGYIVFILVAIGSLNLGIKYWKKGNKVIAILFFIVSVFIALGFLGMLLGTQDGSIN